VDVTLKDGVPYCRVTKDPMNQVYASWLCTIAGACRNLIWSNNRERIGDMVETALGVCRLVDEYVDTLGYLIGDPNSMCGRIEASIQTFLESGFEKRYQFGTGTPSKSKKKRVDYSQEVRYTAEQMSAPIITIEDVIGPKQRRKIFSEPSPDAVPSPVPMETEESPEDESPVELRVCNQCDSGKMLTDCLCDASSAFRSIRDRLRAKRSTPDQWLAALSTVEHFCKNKRHKIAHSQREEQTSTAPGDVNMPKSGEEVISSSSPGYAHGGTSKSPGEAISSEQTGDPSASGAVPRPKAKTVSRQSLSSVIMEQRDFDTNENGQKYASIGPRTLLNFEYDCNRTQGGKVCDFGIQRVSENKPEIRFGPTTNEDEGWCSLGRRKLSINNRVTVINADRDLLNVTFTDSRFRNWTYANYHHRDLQDLSKLFSGFLRH
jgi:hypothetical protein